MSFIGLQSSWAQVLTLEIRNHPSQTYKETRVSASDPLTSLRVELDASELDTSKVDFKNKQGQNEYLNERIQQKLWDLGFFDAKPDSVEISRQLVTVWLPAFKRYRWTSKPLRYFSPELTSDCIQPTADSFFSIEAVSECRNHLLRQLQDAAYLEASVELDSLQLDPITLQVSVVLRISKQTKAKVHRAYFMGQKSPDSWLTSMSGLRSGAPVSREVLEDSRIRLIQTKRFISVSEPLVIQSDSLWEVAFDVNEKPLTQFDMVVGYTPTISGKPQLVGSGSLWLHHVLADGNHWKLTYQRLKPNTGHLELEIEQAGVKEWPIGLSIKTQLRQQDTLWNTRSLLLNGWWKYNPVLRIQSSLLYESINYPSRASLIDTHSGWYGSLGITLETLDQWINPRRGVELSIMADRGNQRLHSSASGREQQDRQRLLIKAALFQPLHRRWILKAGVWGAWLNTKNIQDSDLWSVGGVNSIRGYQEEQFRARRYLITDLETRFLLDATSNFFVFYSLGWLEQARKNQSPDTVSIEHSLSSYGLGLNYATNLGVLKISIAKNSKIPLSNTLIHIGLSTLN